MNRDESVALFLQGREAWNTWAEKMLAERKVSEAAPEWTAMWDLLGGLDEPRGWSNAAAVDFSQCHFLVRGTEEANKKSGEPQIKADTPKAPVVLIPVDADEIDFRGFVFPGIASFENATFSGFADFWGTAFYRRADFRETMFNGPVRFYGANFTGLATFWRATFADNVIFESVTFKNIASFLGTLFEKGAKFAGIRVERSFDMTGASFAQVPAFNQADFKQAPDFDDVRFPLPGFWRTGKSELVAQYRALRRMAIQGADYEREQMAYKGELRSRRWTVDKWWSAGTWIGLFYDAFADCGRSIVRPANAWLASILLFAAFYWQRAAAGVEARCEEAGGAAVQALFLSVKNALVIFGGTRDARVNQAYLCLYNGSAEQPHIPPTVTFVETLAQIPVSATLIFLFLLAVKNRFKIK